MAGRGFVSFARLVYKVLNEELSRKKMELWEEIDTLTLQIGEKVKKAEPKEGDRKKTSVYFRPKPGTDDLRVEVVISFTVKPEKYAPEETERLRELLREYERVKKLYKKLKIAIEGWKATAISKETYFREPFPEEYCEFLPQELKKAINCEGGE